jgi:hypothetical protein
MDETKEDLLLLSNNEILFKIKQYEATHTSIKEKMLSDLDRLETVEKQFDIANKIILKRLKGE